MSLLIKDNTVVEDPYVRLDTEVPLPPRGSVLVSLAHWQADRAGIAARSEPVGLWLASDQHPQLIAADLAHFEVVALEFPRFRDGRPYTYARLLRERYGYRGEVRAIGDVLADQLHLMIRAGFNAFEFDRPDALHTFRAAANSFSVWYQPAADTRPTAMELRERKVEA
jgi:uncharacterized protein (DUF934 family)